MSVIKAGTTLTTAYTVEADTTGALEFKTGPSATLAMSISASGVVTFPATTGFDIASANITNLTSGTTSATVLRSASGTITNLLATSLTVSSGSTLNGGVVINEPGADVDFRVEGDTDANLIFADASTDRLGIGTSSPGAKLDVASAGTVAARIYNTSSTTDAYLICKNSSGESYFGVNATGPYIYTATAQAMVFHTNNAERARITSDGQIITAYDGGKYTQRGIVVLGSAFDNPVQSIITLPASGSTNSVISIKVTCNQNAYATAAANQHIGNARAMWDGSAWVKEVDTMTVVCGDIATVGTLAWSGSTLQYTTNRVSNYDNYLVTYEVLNNPTVTTLTYAF